MAEFPISMHVDPRDCLRVGDLYVPKDTRYTDENIEVAVYLGRGMMDLFPLSAVGIVKRDSSDEFKLGELKEPHKIVYSRLILRSSVDSLCEVSRKEIISSDTHDLYQRYVDGAITELMELTPLLLTLNRRYNERASFSLQKKSVRRVRRRRSEASERTLGPTELKYWRVHVKNSFNEDELRKRLRIRRGEDTVVRVDGGKVSLDEFFNY
ncbi:hypothetical protein HOC01_03420 [archaeon]|jgi:hypothetical protein|nr:hypothetical protein [archaeon]MBT6698539.1 hypothetical protein [archaeon]